MGEDGAAADCAERKLGVALAESLRFENLPQLTIDFIDLFAGRSVLL